MAETGRSNERGAPAREPAARSGRPQRPAGVTQFAQRLRAARDQLGLTLHEAASRTGISPTFLSELERGSRQPSMRTMTRLTSAFSLDATAQPPAEPPNGAGVVDEALLRHLAARLVRADAPVLELAREHDVDAAVVRAALPTIRARLALVGLTLVVDADHARVLDREDSTAAVVSTAESGAPQRRAITRISSPILIGRESELERLLSVTQQTPSVTVVRGEAGVGKSRLVNEALARHELSRFRRLMGHCVPVAEPFPLAPIVDALRAGADLSSISGSPLAAALQSLLPELAVSQESPPASHGEPRCSRHMLFRALRQLISNLDPVVLVLEDLHWADTQTIDFLRLLLARPPHGLALIVTYREEDLAAGSGVLGLTARPVAGLTTLTLDLHTLAPPDVRRLVAAILDTDEVSEEFAVQLHEQTSGLPFAVEEMLRLVNDRLALAHRSDALMRRSLAALDVPSNIRDFVLERVAQLDTDARAVVDMAAVLSVPTTEDVLGAALGWTGRRLTAAMRSALDAAVLFRVSNSRYALRHPLASHAVYQAVALPERRRMHLRAAAALEGLDPRPVAQLARHYREAARQAKWQACAEEAADRAAAQGDQAAAAATLADVLRGPELGATDRARLAVKYGTAALSAHTLQSDAAALLRAVVADTRIPVTMRGQIRVRLGQLLLEIGDGGTGTRELEVAAAELRRRPESAAIVMGNLALPSAVEGSERDHRHWLARAAAIADRHGDPSLSATIAGIRALLLLSYGDPAGWAVAQELRATSQTTDATRQLLWLDAHLMGACFHLGHYDRARTFLADAESAAAGVGWGRYLPLRETTMLQLDWAAGEWDSLALRARRYADDMAVEHPLGELFARVIIGQLALAHGQLDDAEEVLRYVHDEAQRVGGVLALIPLAGAGLGRIWMIRGDPLAAWEETRSALTMIARKEIWVWAAEVAPVAVRALAAAGRLAEARALTRDFSTHLSGRDAPLARAALELCNSELAAASEGGAETAAGFARARSLYASLPRPYDAALAGMRQGEALLVAHDERAPDVLLNSLAELERIGATADAGRARRWLRRHRIPLRRGWGGGRQAYGRELSPREEEVARLVAQGYSNIDIGEALFLAPKTIEHHISSVFRKLGVRSRASFIAMWLGERQPAAAKLGDSPN